MNSKLKRAAAVTASVIVAAASNTFPVMKNTAVTARAKYGTGNNIVEYLDRGVTAVGTGSGMLVSWRFLANDDDNAEFRLYRDGTLIYTSGAGKSTCFLDTGGSASSKYRVDTVVNNVVKSSDSCNFTSQNSYFDIKMDVPTASTSGVTYSPNDCSVGDVDGDGVYELFVKWDPSNSQDNSKSGNTDNVYIDCYRLDGTKLWRIDLGLNIRAGAHYTQFLVADFDCDGRAEMTCKTADGTVDGTGKVIGDGSKNYRNSKGYILTGPEYYTLFDGATGAALDTVDYNPGRGTVSSWGDNYGNRVDRFLGSVVYLDGVHPSAVTVRGYYTRMTACAYDVVDKKLVQRWFFDTGNSSSAAGYGDGNHNCMPADVDNDGKQELVLGATCIDDNGQLLWCTNTGHGDALHVGDFLPDRDGLEVWICHEEKPYGVTLLDAKNGNRIFHADGNSDTGRCCADNVWTGNDGAEFWGLGNNVYNGSGTLLSCRRPAINFLIHWDGDLEREILDGYTDSPATIADMGADGKLTTILSTDGYYTCNTTKGTPCLSADIFGDWREELIVRAADSKSVRIYCTTYDTDYRITTLMHDVQYRTQVATEQNCYNQPPHQSFYLGSEKPLPDRPAVTVNSQGTSSFKPGAVIDTAHKYRIRNKNSGLYLEVADGNAAAGTNVQQGTSEYNGWLFESAGSGYYYIYSELGDSKTYLLDLDYGKPDNGTNIGIYTDTSSDAQLFKFVDNGDGTYTITTKNTSDGSCIGIDSDSTETGANAIQWECNGADSQKWILEIKIDPLDGVLIKNLVVKDTDNYTDWRIESGASVGSLIFGDREFTFTSLPDAVSGSEIILTACDSKFCSTDLAVFTAGGNMTLYVALDNRVTAVPSWLSGWAKTDLTAVSSNDVTFNFYSMDFKKGDEVTLGTNGQSASCVNYAAFAVARNEEPTTEPTTVPPTTEDDKILFGDADLDGQVTINDVVTIFCYSSDENGSPLSDNALRNADVYQTGDGVNSSDAVTIQKYLAKIIFELPEK
ncbi:MAG: RICIN domain-containing protein [Oscillospiraceae bacterium]|nr:RICIN domain-containing protein [Oscillospiraceae bacterium]